MKIAVAEPEPEPEREIDQDSFTAENTKNKVCMNVS